MTSTTTIIKSSDNEAWLAVIENNDMQLIVEGLDFIKQDGRDYSKEQRKKAESIIEMVNHAGKLY